MKKIVYEFIPAGSTVNKTDKKLYLDVGNRLENGVIDHHQPDAPAHSASFLVYHNSEFVQNDIKTIVLHKNPDLDCVASSYLAIYFLTYQEFPKFAEELCVFVDKIDFGYASKNRVSLSSIFAFLKQGHTRDEEVVKMGHILIEDLADCGFDNKLVPDKYKYISKKIEKDYLIYLDDLKNSTVIEAKLPYKLKKGFKLSKGLVLVKPKSTLFKSWARNDTSRFEQGYDFLVVRWNKKRVTISVKPDDIIYLKGIGDRLNQAEKEKRKFLGIAIREKHREGYGMPDPWYDGRNPNHNYTIIDSPHGGTILSFGEILDIITCG